MTTKVTSRSINYVPAYTPTEHRRNELTATAGEILQSTEFMHGHVDTSAVYRPMATIAEQTSAKDRAIGFLAKHSVLYGFEAMLALAIGLLVWSMQPIGFLIFFVIVLLSFAPLASVTHIILNWHELSHTAAGVERLRVLEAGRTTRHHSDNSTQLRRDIFMAYMQMRERERDPRELR